MIHNAAFVPPAVFGAIRAKFPVHVKLSTPTGWIEARGVCGGGGTVTTTTTAGRPRRRDAAPTMVPGSATVEMAKTGSIGILGHRCRRRRPALAAGWLAVRRNGAPSQRPPGSQLAAAPQAGRRQSNSVLDLGSTVTAVYKRSPTPDGSHSSS